MKDAETKSQIAYRYAKNVVENRVVDAEKYMAVLKRSNKKQMARGSNNDYYSVKMYDY